MGRILTLIACFGIFMPESSAQIQTSLASDVPQDTAILELTLPEGASFKINDQQYRAGVKGETRILPFRPMPPNQSFTYQMEVLFPDGSVTHRTLALRGGERVRLPILSLHVQRPEFVLQSGLPGYVFDGAFSEDGNTIVLGSNDLVYALYDVASGRQLRRFKPQTLPLSFQFAPLAVSPDHRYLVTGSGTQGAILWNIESGERIRGFPGAHGPMAFSPDGRWLAICSERENSEKSPSKHEIVIWNTSDGFKTLSLRGHDGFIYVMTFSPDGRFLLTGSKDCSAIIWDLEIGQQKKLVLEGHDKPVTAADFQSDGQRVLTGSTDGTVILWESMTGLKLRTFEAQKLPRGYGAEARSCIAFCPGSRQIVTAGVNPSVILWDTASGEKLHSFDAGRVIAINPITHKVLTRPGHDLSENHVGKLCIWDWETGAELRSLTPTENTLYPIGFSPDGRHLRSSATLASSTDEIAWEFSLDPEHLTWNEESNADDQVNMIENAKHETRSAVSANGQLRVEHDTTGSIAVWDTRSKQILRTLSDSQLMDTPIVTPDGQLVAATDKDGKQTRLWNARTGVALSSWQGSSPIFSWDGQQIMTKSARNSAATTKSSGPLDLEIRDVRSGHMLQAFAGTGSGSGLTMILSKNCHFFTPNGRQIVSESGEGTIQLWDIATGDKLCELVSINNTEDRLVFTPEGLFDGSDGGRQKVAFRIGSGLHVVSVDQFFSDFYTPGLLAKIANGERPMPSVELGHELPPKVQIVSPQFGGTIEEPTVTLIIEATDQGGGVRVPWIKHNGARLLAEGITEQNGPIVRLTQELQLVEGENRIEVRSATNNDFATIDSLPATLVLRYEKPLHKPHLHLLAIGTNYAEPNLQLRFARNDAEAVAKLFESRGQSLYEKVHVHLLLDEQVTKSAIKTLLTEKDSVDDTIAKVARPQDSLLVLFGGHGTIVGQRYFFIPHDFKRQAADLEADIRNQGLAADELGDWLASVPCLKRMLIFDTCASGAAVDLVRTSRNPFALRGVIERLNRTQGVFTIAASAATDEAKEVSELGHGVLTYTLLAGLGAVNHGPLDGRQIETRGSQRVVSIMDWFGYADDHVPELMKMYFGKTQDIQFNCQGTVFPVLTLEDTATKSENSK